MVEQRLKLVRGLSCLVSSRTPHGRMQPNIHGRDKEMWLYIWEAKKNKAANKCWHLLRRRKERFCSLFFLVVGHVFHPRGVDSSLFAVLYLSMIFICPRLCFIILFTRVPLSAPHSSPTNVTHACICSMLLSGWFCLSHHCQTHFV